MPSAPPSLESDPPPARRLRRYRPHALSPPGSHLDPHRMPSVSTRQGASAFNQPLSFDTSSVTDMTSMFYVRSARALCPPQSSSWPLPLHAACAATAPTPSRLPLRTSTRFVCPAFDLAARGCVQPAAQLRHLQRHRHEVHVCGALRACPLPPQPSSRALPMRAACAATAPTPSRLPSRRAPRPASYALLLTCRAQPHYPTPTSC